MKLSQNKDENFEALVLEQAYFLSDIVLRLIKTVLRYWSCFLHFHILLGAKILYDVSRLS